MTPQPASFNHIDYSDRPWVAGDRLRRKRLGWLCFGKLGDLATYEGGADYVPGLDAGQYAVKLDQPNGRGHRGEAYWDLPGLQADWDRIIEGEMAPAPRSNGKASTTSKTPLNEESHLASMYDTSGDPVCEWCGSTMTWEDDGDGESGPNPYSYCSNPDCPGDPNDPAGPPQRGETTAKDEAQQECDRRQRTSAHPCTPPYGDNRPPEKWCPVAMAGTCPYAED